jgi:hypothetical protein
MAIGAALNNLIATCACASVTAHDAILASVTMNGTRNGRIFNSFGSHGFGNPFDREKKPRRCGPVSTSATTMPRHFSRAFDGQERKRLIGMVIWLSK